MRIILYKYLGISCQGQTKLSMVSFKGISIIEADIVKSHNEN